MDRTDDTISRNGAIKAINDLPNCPNGYSDTYDKACIIGVLEDLPSAQSERKTGRWRNAYADYEGFGVYCSCCNEITVYQYKYCPNCGAKMEEE